MLTFGCCAQLFRESSGQDAVNAGMQAHFKSQQHRTEPYNQMSARPHYDPTMHYAHETYRKYSHTLSVHEESYTHYNL